MNGDMAPKAPVDRGQWDDVAVGQLLSDVGVLLDQLFHEPPDHLRDRIPIHRDQCFEVADLLWPEHHDDY